MTGVSLPPATTEHGEGLYLSLEAGRRRLRSRLEKLGKAPAGLHLATEWRRLGAGCVEALARKQPAERSRLTRRSSNAFHHCKRRAKKAGEFLDFTVGTLCDKIAEALEKPCPYCAQPVTLRNFSPDHKQPLSRNGSHCLENVVICCRVCNFAKGMLTDAEYRALLVLTKEWPPAIRSDFFARLRGGGRRMR